MTATDPARSALLNMGDILLRKYLMGGTLAAVLSFYGYQVLRSNPQEGFALLRQFGPSFLISSLAILLLWDVLKLGVTNVGRLADSMQTLSASVAQIAEKDDRRSEEMQRIGQFNAQTSERMLQILLDQGAQLKEISSRLDRAEYTGGKQ